jgi:hypothetical protein
MNPQDLIQFTPLIGAAIGIISIIIHGLKYLNHSWDARLTRLIDARFNECFESFKECCDKNKSEITKIDAAFQIIRDIVLKNKPVNSIGSIDL